MLVTAPITVVPVALAVFALLCLCTAALYCKMVASQMLHAMLTVSCCLLRRHLSFAREPRGRALPTRVEERTARRWKGSACAMSAQQRKLLLTKSTVSS